MLQANASISRAEIIEVDKAAWVDMREDRLERRDGDTCHLQICCSRKLCPSTGRQSWCWTWREQIALLMKEGTGSCVSMSERFQKCTAEAHVNVSFYGLPAGSVRDGLSVDFCGCVRHDGWEVAVLFSKYKLWIVLYHEHGVVVI